MTNRRLKVQDLVKADFYQTPKAFAFNKKYREGLSDGAKYAYTLIRDRFRLSEWTTGQEELKNIEHSYVNDDNEVFCFMENAELEFTMNKSHTTIKGYIKELIKFDLIDLETIPGGAHKIYCMEPENNEDDYVEFIGKMAYYKHAQKRAKKKLEPKKTEAQCIQEAKERMEKKKGSKNHTPAKRHGGIESSPPGDAKVSPPGDAESSPPGGQNLAPNKNYGIDTEPSENYVIDTESSSSFSEPVKEQSKTLEEEKSNVIQVSDNYLILVEVLKAFDMEMDQRGLNVIKKTLMENKIEHFHVGDVARAVVKHIQNVENYKAQGKVIGYVPVFFANNLVDRIREGKEMKKLQSENEQRDTYVSGPVFYNWLEERE